MLKTVKLRAHAIVRNVRVRAGKEPVDCTDAFRDRISYRGEENAQIRKVYSAIDVVHGITADRFCGLAPPIVQIGCSGPVDCR